MHWLIPFFDPNTERALLACILIGFTNGFLGAYVVLRRMALTADALAHALFPGVVVGALLFGMAPLALMIGGLAAALLVALGAWLISSTTRVKEDTSVGILLTTAMALGLILAAKGSLSEHLDHYLFGDLLNISNAKLWMSYGISLLTLTTLILCQRPLLLTLVEPAVAQSLGVPVRLLGAVLMALLVLCMLAAVQAVGVILALSLFVAPAATMLMCTNDLQRITWSSGALGALGALGGLWLAQITALPAGASIALVLGGIFLLSFLASPRYGLASRLRRKHLHEESLARWKKS